MMIGVLLGIVAAHEHRKGRSQFATEVGHESGAARAANGPRRVICSSEAKWRCRSFYSFAAGLFLESLRNARRLDLGFQPENRLTVSVNPGMQGYHEEQGVALHMEALRRIDSCQA